MNRYQIAVLPGDGIGPEVICEGLKVLNTAAGVGGVMLDYVTYPFGAEHYLNTGEVLPESAVSELKDFDAIYFGAAGDPRVPPGVLEVGLVLKIRFDLDQYVNLRPVKLFPNVASPLKDKVNIDFLVIRENTEDFYNGLGATFRTGGIAGEKHTCDLVLKRAHYQASVNITLNLGIADNYAVNLGLITRKGAERVVRYAFELARKKGKTHVTSVDKANVMPDMYGLWRESFSKVAAEYPDIQSKFTFVDAVCMWFVKNPEDFEVVVAPNLFGDIITDLGAVIQGGLGFAAGANINPEGVSMFEPIHGSAPKYKGLNVANPIAAILSGALLLETIGENSLSQLVEKAVEDVLAEGKVRTRDMGGKATTSEMGDAIATKIRDLAVAKTVL